MKRLMILAALAVAAPTGARTETTDGPAVRFEHGLVSATFDAVPAEAALAEIRRAAQATIVVPPGLLDGKRLTLDASRQDIDLFLRRVLDALDLKDYVLVYQADSDRGRLVVVPARLQGGGDGRDVTDPARAGSRPGPVYVPPKEPPVYTSPVGTPTYVPARRVPVVRPPGSGRGSDAPPGSPRPGGP
jgi:hypothetical protein